MSLPRGMSQRAFAEISLACFAFAAVVDVIYLPLWAAAVAVPVQVVCACFCVMGIRR